MTVTVVIDNTSVVAGLVKRLTKQECLVGIPDTTADRQPDPNAPSNDINNATLGYIHEYGSPAQNIPARPFLEPGIEDATPQIVKILEKAASKALGGEPVEVARALNAVGLVAVASVQQKITDGPFAPLSPFTIANRQAQGRTGTKPLIDTGQLRQSITYVIRDRGKTNANP